VAIKLGEPTPTCQPLYSSSADVELASGVHAGQILRAIGTRVERLLTIKQFSDRSYRLSHHLASALICFMAQDDSAAVVLTGTNGGEDNDGLQSVRPTCSPNAAPRQSTGEERPKECKPVMPCHAQMR
jgi:hypothetical protein